MLLCPSNPHLPLSHSWMKFSSCSSTWTCSLGKLWILLVFFFSNYVSGDAEGKWFSLPLIQRNWEVEEFPSPSLQPREFEGGISRGRKDSSYSPEWRQQTVISSTVTSCSVITFSLDGWCSSRMSGCSKHRRTNSWWFWVLVTHNQPNLLDQNMQGTPQDG